MHAGDRAAGPSLIELGLLNAVAVDPYDRIVRVRTSLFALALAAASANGAAFAGPPSPDGAAIVRGEGRVKPDGTGTWRETTTADILTVGVTVQATPEQPLEMILPDGVTITLEPSALARWMPGGKLPSETNHWTHGYHLLLEEGEAEVRMPPAPRGSHAFLVSSKAGTLTDWRGQLHVSVHGEATAAAIYEGALVVGSNGHGFPVYDGAGILMHRGVNPDKARGIPASPVWDTQSGGFRVVPRDSPTSLDLAWSAVPGTVEYRVEVAIDPSMVRVIHRTTTAEPRVTIPATATAQGGATWVHVRAVGRGGIVGAWSIPRPIHILRYDLPDGAFVARDGAIVLPGGQSLVVHEAPNGAGGSSPDPIEVAYEDVAGPQPSYSVPLYWGRLGGSLRLSEDAPVRVVHLRDPALGAETRLVLARRELRAYVALGPSNARWPTDPIDARVEVRDPSGRIDVSNESVTLETLLDLTPLSVDWQRTGNTWRGRIAPRLIGDPSVVRVVVKDGHGSEIGRGFVELEPVASR